MTWRFRGSSNVGYLDVDFIPSRDDASLQPITGRLYFPTDQSEAKGWPERWMPSTRYVTGIVDFLFSPRSLRTWKYWLVKQVVWTVAMVCNAGHAALGTKHATLATSSPERHPLLVFSHGIAGFRGMYSIVAAELASHGWVVLALEHTDGTACCSKLPGPRVRYQGYRAPDWGNTTSYLQLTESRIRDCMAAARLLQQLHEGCESGGQLLSAAPASLLAAFRGRLDLDRMAVSGHSFGGATAAAVASTQPGFRCAVCLDPWWKALGPQDQPALHPWATGNPLLVIGSHEWNTPNASGELACGGDMQEMVLAGAGACSSGTADALAEKPDPDPGSSGGGAVLVIPKGSTHHSFNDALCLFGTEASWALSAFGVRQKLDATLGLQMIMDLMLGFLDRHCRLLKPGPKPDVANGISADGVSLQLADEPTALPDALPHIAVTHSLHQVGIGADETEEYRQTLGEYLAVPVRVV